MRIDVPRLRCARSSLFSVALGIAASASRACGSGDGPEKSMGFGGDKEWHFSSEGYGPGTYQRLWLNFGS